MEHYRSTLGTAAVAAFGLVVAAHMLHPGNFEDTPRAGRPVTTKVEAASTLAAARIDPPFSLYLRPSASASEMAVLAPRMTAPLPAGMTMMPILPAGMTTVGDAPQETGAQRRSKGSTHSLRAKPAVAAHARTAQAASLSARSALAGSPDFPSRYPARGDEG